MIRKTIFVIILFLSIQKMTATTPIWVYTPINQTGISCKISQTYSTNSSNDLILYQAYLNNDSSIVQSVSYYDFKRTDYSMAPEYQNDTPLSLVVKLYLQTLSGTLESVNNITLYGGGNLINGKEVAISYINTENNIPEMMFYRVYYWQGKLYIVSIKGTIQDLNTLVEFKNTIFNSLYAY